jgi:hypothetical protein
MFPSGPLNNHAYEVLSELGYLTVSTLKGMERPHQLEVMLDFKVTQFGTAGTTGITLFGKDAVGWRLQYDAPAAGVIRSAAARFLSTRNSVTKTSTDFTIQLGQRHLFYARDDGSTVKAYLDGVPETAQTWTAAQAAYPIDTDANPLYVGYDSVAAIATLVRVYEAFVKVNGSTALHLRPKPFMADLATPLLDDLSEFGNNASFSGTVGTVWRIVKAWGRSPAFTGKETVG